MNVLLSLKVRLSGLPVRRSMRLLLCALLTAVILGCAPGYAPEKTPEEDIDALLAAPQYARLQIVYEADAGRSVTAAIFAGDIIIEYFIDDKLAGHHSAYSSFDEVVNLLGGDHEFVVQQCYRGLMTLGGRSCQYIKYHFRILPREQGRISVEGNVLRPRTAGLFEWYELEASRY